MTENTILCDAEQKIIVTIVSKGSASKIVTASRKAGAEGGTILLGSGTAGKSVYLDILGVNFDPEKEIILTLAPKDRVSEILQAILDKGNLNTPGKGIGFVINVKGLAGICHLRETDSQYAFGGNSMSENCPLDFDLIVTIVNNGFAEEVIDASKKAGAEGGTIIHGRGSGIHENMKLFGIPIEPEKEIVLTIIDRNKSENVLKAIRDAVDLNKPGKGVAFVLEVEKTVGICHLLNDSGKVSDSRL